MIVDEGAGPTLAGLVADPEVTAGGGRIDLTFLLDGPAPAGGARINLASSDPSRLFVPERITPPPGRPRALSDSWPGCPRSLPWWS